MRLVIQIPCFNEEAQLPAVMASLPKAIPGVSEILILVIDDGSTDNTAALARQLGADRVVVLPQNQGLARAFSEGINTGLEMGADIIVNTDADLQYDSDCIADLISPVIAGKADIAIGDRNTRSVPEFSWLKRQLQGMGSFVVRTVSRTNVRDASSGFRAYSRRAAAEIFVLTRFSYTMESLIQAGDAGFTIANVPVKRNPDQRPSRLFRSNFHYIRSSTATILRVLIQYRPLPFFLSISLLLGVGALLAWLPFISGWVQGQGEGHIQSIILGAVLALAAVQVLVLGILADSIRANRAISQHVLTRLKLLELGTSDSTITGESHQATHTSTAVESEHKRADNPTTTGTRAPDDWHPS